MQLCRYVGGRGVARMFIWLSLPSALVAVSTQFPRHKGSRDLCFILSGRGVKGHTDLEGLSISYRDVLVAWSPLHSIRFATTHV
jgi:hypothetical protein